MAEKYDAIAEFWTYNPWRSAEMHKRYNEVAVFEHWHKDNPKFQKSKKTNSLFLFLFFIISFLLLITSLSSRTKIFTNFKAFSI